MDEYSERTYGDRIAGVYDLWYSGFDPNAVQALAGLAQGGPALELGIGTGRIAIPLQDMGIVVKGVDASEAMVARLREKPGGERIRVAMGNFADVAIDGQYSLVYVVFNTFYSLLTQDEQVRCFQNVARHLGEGGVFVIEAFVPDLTRFTGGQAMRLTRIGDKDVQIDVSQHEQDKQLITSQHLLLSEHGTQLYPVRIRYIWPSEMDLMARLSGLQLKERWSDWDKSEFSANSTKHISVYKHKKS